MSFCGIKEGVMKGKRFNGSYTVEAAIYIPIILFVLIQSLQIAIEFWQESREREISKCLRKIDIVEEFYGYQIMGDVMEEMEDD